MLELSNGSAKEAMPNTAVVAKAKHIEAGLPDIHFHSLRQSVALIPLEQNTHPRLVAELLGIQIYR